MTFSDFDTAMMRRALQLAARAEGRTEPNPMVGCVLVRDERVIAEGFHRRCGTLHAERDALRNCPSDPAGATAYVTLEPCCHTGRQPPCTTALLEAGIARVVAAVADVDPRVARKGFARLRRGGIVVQTGLLADEARALMAPYRKVQQQGLPWVILKWAQSVDGVIATASGDSKWITDKAARRHVHRVRARVDAIIVGAGTAVLDDPLLTARDVPLRRVATRIVCDAGLRIRPDSQLVRTAGQTPTIIATARTAPAARRRRLERAGCRVLTLPVRGGRIALRPLLRRLASEEMTNVVVEGGGRLLGSFWEAGLADEVHVYLGRRLVGGGGSRRPLAGRDPRRIADGLVLPEDANLRRLGTGWLLQARLPRSG